MHFANFIENYTPSVVRCDLRGLVVNEYVVYTLRLSVCGIVV